MKSTSRNSGEHGSEGTHAARAAGATWRKIDEALEPIIGLRGIDALYNKSLRLTCVRYPFLSVVDERTPESRSPASLEHVLSSQSSSAATAASAALLQSFGSALGALIGASLTESLLRDVRDNSHHRKGSVDAMSVDARNERPAGGAAQPERIGELLVLAALRAEADAEAATRALDEFVDASQRDPLTDTPNRALFLDRLQSAIAMARRRKSRLALLFIDLDDFKKVNDSLGHGSGDEVLQLVAGRLTATVRNSDSVCRYGGDEFLVLLPEVSRVSDAALIARKIVAALAKPVTTAGHTFSLSASLGISLYPDDGEDAESLISRADIAMYHAKRSEPGSIACYGETIVDASTQGRQFASATARLETPHATRN